MTRPAQVPKSHRFPPDLYAEAETLAAEREESVSDVLRAALVAYVERKDQP